MDNLKLADERARRGKTHTWGVMKFDRNKKKKLLQLQQMLSDGTYTTSPYTTFKIYEPKERLIFRLPYFPDRIVHHAIMNIVEDIWVKQFISHTYSCIKGRGIHKCVKDVRNALDEDVEGTKYCLKFDIKKFYPSINHDVLKGIIRKKIKDVRLLALIDSIIDSADGVPIGNYLSQFFANLYLSDFDHWVKEVLKAKYYFRYADDIVLLSDDKEKLHKWFAEIKEYISTIKLDIKSNYQIFPVDKRGIDFVGYVFYHSHTKLRKSIKNKLFRTINNYKDNKDVLNRHISSYFGWLKYCDSKNLLCKIEHDTGLHYSNWRGTKVSVSSFYGKFIRICHIQIHSNKFEVQFIYNDRPYVFCSKNKKLFKRLLRTNLKDREICLMPRSHIVRRSQK